jgi:hypothetical protein
VSTQPGTGTAPDQVVGLRNQLRARWRALPAVQRASISSALAVGFARLCYFTLDHALGFAVGTIAAIYWLRRLPFYPRVAGELVLIGLF